MRAKSENIKLGLAIFVLLTLFLPLAQSRMGLVEVKPLSGAVVYPEKHPFTLSGWFDGSYQKNKEEYVNDMFGFRNLCVRVNNQIAFSLFGEVKANEVVIGKEGYLFEEQYIKSYLGEDFIGDSKVKKKMASLKYISDTLAKLNKQLMLVFSVGKASFYP